MKYILLFLLLPALAAGQRAVISIDTDRVIDTIDPNIYGLFMEPIASTRTGAPTNTLYGPIYNPESPRANKDGLVQDYIDAAREL